MAMILFCSDSGGNIILRAFSLSLFNVLPLTLKSPSVSLFQSKKKGDDWEENTLNEVCIVKRGSSPRPIKKYITENEDGINWIKIGDTKNVNKFIYRTAQKITKEGAEKSRYVKKGDFILSNSMSFGKPYIMKSNGCIHDGWFKLEVHNFLISWFGFVGCLIGRLFVFGFQVTE
jgi:type I restriction enzyme S subunit